MNWEALKRAFTKADHIAFLLILPLVFVNLYIATIFWVIALSTDIIEHLRTKEQAARREAEK